jgi:SAM-dependent methyltransferase
VITCGLCVTGRYPRAMESIVAGVLKNQILAVSAVQRRRLARAAPYEPTKNAAEYVRDVFENSSQRVAGRRPLSGDVLEIGPGGNLGALLMYLAAGCDRGVALDVVPLVTDQQALYESITPDAAELLKRIEYRTGEPIEQPSLPDGGFGIIFSAACLEHVADPAAALRTMYRLLKPGGVTTHSIDLRDHRDFTDPLAFLRHSERIWWAASSRRLVTNRWRASDWQRGFESAGFLDVTVEPHEQVDITEEMRSRFHRSFHTKDLTHLGTLLVNVTATKPE